MRFSAAVVVAFASAVTGLALFGGQAVVAGDDLRIPGESPLELCEKEHADDLVKIDRVDLLPNPPQAGHELVIKASGVVTAKIEKGSYIRLQVKYGLIRLINQVVDLCDQITNVDLECPIEEGVLTITKSVELPREIPPGKYWVQADVYTESDEPITCLQAQVDFGKRALSGFLDL